MSLTVIIKKEQKQTLSMQTDKDLWTPGNKWRVLEGCGGWIGSPGMGIKEGMYFMEHWVLCANNESWNTNEVLYGD